MKRLKQFGLLALVMVTSIMFAACGSKKTEIDFTISYNGSSTVFPQDIKSIVNTFAEWDTLRGDAAQFTELDAKYNEQFFTNNSLIIYAFTSGYSPAQFEITKVSKNGNELVVEAIINAGDMAMVSNGVVVVEIKKPDIKGVNSLRVVLQ